MVLRRDDGVFELEIILMWETFKKPLILIQTHVCEERGGWGLLSIDLRDVAK